MSAIFGFTFHIGRMTEVLTPDIYIERELTDSEQHKKNMLEYISIFAMQFYGCNVETI